MAGAHGFERFVDLGEFEGAVDRHRERLLCGEKVVDLSEFAPSSWTKTKS